MLHISPTNSHLLATLKNKGHTKSLPLEQNLKTFLESRQENGPKAEKGEDRSSNRTTGRITREQIEN